MGKWQVQQAKAHFSELLDDAERKGPQIITRHGAERAVVLAIDEYRSLTARKKDFIAHLLSVPDFDGVQLERSNDTGRAFSFDD